MLFLDKEKKSDKRAMEYLGRKIGEVWSVELLWWLKHMAMQYMEDIFTYASQMISYILKGSDITFS